MKILVTGASGSLGSALLAQLEQIKDVQIYATDIQPSPCSFKNLVFKQFDIRQIEFLNWVELVEPDVIVHLASILQIGGQLTREMAYQIDVVATEALISKACDIGCKKLIVTTSGAAYGYYPRNKGKEITENWSRLGNEDYFYSDHKRQIERLLEQARRNCPTLKQVVFRPGAILGPNFKGPVVDLFKQRVFTGLVGYPGLFNFIWVDDVVDYLLEAISTDICGEFNIAGEGVLSMKRIAQICGRPYIPLPAPLVQAALAILKPLGLIQYGPEQVKFIKYRPVLSSQKIRQEFVHQPKYTSESAFKQFTLTLSSEAK